MAHAPLNALRNKPRCFGITAAEYCCSEATYEGAEKIVIGETDFESHAIALGDVHGQIGAVTSTYRTLCGDPVADFDARQIVSVIPKGFRP